MLIFLAILFFKNVQINFIKKSYILCVCYKNNESKLNRCIPLGLGSSGSVQSWASSLSADSQSEEAAADFMKSFVPLLFEAPSTIDQEQKANFGQMVLVSIVNAKIYKSP